jgi:hypothetical protein
MASRNERGTQSLISDYSKDWRRLQLQKARHSGGVESRALLSLAMVYGEHYVNQSGFNLQARQLTDADKNRLYLVFNFIGRSVWRKLGRLWSIDNQFRATPNTLDPAAFDNADVVSDMIRAINRKVGEGNVHWNRLFNLLTFGVVIEHVPWMELLGDEALPQFDDDGQLVWEDQWNDEEVTEADVMAAVQGGTPPERFRPKEVLQTVGDVGSEIFNPLNFFIDASVPSIDKLASDQACYLAQIKTRGWVRDIFGSEAAAKIGRRNDLNIVKTQLLEGGRVVSGLNLKDMIPAIQGSHLDSDPDMCIFLTRYQPPGSKNPHGCRSFLTPEGVMLEHGDLPYETIPCVDIHLRPNATTFWTGDFVTDMVPGQKFLNKRMSQLGESANANIYEILLLGEGLTSDDIPTDYSGEVENGLDDAGNPKVQALQRGTLPAWFIDSIRLTHEFIESVGGSDLLSQRKFPGQIRGPMAVPMLQEILDSEDGPFYTHLGEQLAKVHQMRMNRVKAFYPAARTMHYTGRNNRDEVLIFHKGHIFKPGYDYQITIDPSTLLPELSSLREARVRERLEGPLAALYFNQRTGRIDVSKIADDIRYNDRQREGKATQYRKLARDLIQRLWRGEVLDPHLPMAFWDHDVMMDEFEAAMATTEWLQASMQVKQAFLDFWTKCQQHLQKLHDAQASSMQDQNMQNAIAMTTQQTAAKVASVATEAALEQVAAQQSAAGPNNSNIVEDMRQLMAGLQPGGGANSSRLRPMR